MKTEGRGNAGLMDNEENQRQVSLVAHSPWKSRTRFPHFHRPGDAWKSGKPRVQRRLACSVGDSPIGVMVRSPVAWIAGRRDEQPTRLGI